MGSFPPSNSRVYVIMCVDYVTKWVEVIVFTTNDGQIVSNFLKKIVFVRFRVPRVLISDRRMCFLNMYF